MNYTNNCCEKQAGLPANKPEHLLIAERMAVDILNTDPTFSIEMVKEITNIVRNSLLQRIEETNDKLKYLQNCIDLLKNT